MALSAQTYFVCPYDEKCKMDMSNRRFCKRCRLKKCLDIGMRREYILSDDEKIQKRQKIEENRSSEKFLILMDFFRLYVLPCVVRGWNGCGVGV